MKQKTPIKFKKILGILLSIAFLSVGCGPPTPAQSRVVLNFWDPFENTENLQEIFSDYQQKNPNVDIVYTKKDINTYESDLLNALAAGNGPDIFAINNSWLPHYSDKVVPAPDKTWIFKDYKDAFVDVAVNDFTVEQKIYAAPLSVDSLGLYYNKDILGSSGIATPPKTWTELATDVQKIKRADRTGYFTLSGLAAGANSNVNRGVDIVSLMMLQKGAGAYSSDHSRSTFNETISKNGNYINPGLDALNFYTSFANPGSANYNWNSRSDYSIDAFANGRAGFLFGYSYTADALRQKNPNLNFDVASVPQPNLDDPSVNFANYWGETVSKQSKNQAAAWNFVKYLTSKSVLDKYYANHKLPSSRKDLISIQIQDSDIGVFANANLTAKSFYKPDQVKFDAIFGKMIDNVILSGLPAEDALSQASQQADTLIRQ